MISLLRLEWWFCLGMRKLVQWRKKCIVDSISLPNSHKGFKVSWKQCLNLCSWRWLKPRRNLVNSLFPMGLWISKILLEQGRMKFRSFFLKVIEVCWVSNVEVKLVSIWYSRRKKWVFKIIMFYFYWRDAIAKPGIVIPMKIGIKSNNYEGDPSKHLNVGST